MMVLGGGAFSYERGTYVGYRQHGDKMIESPALAFSLGEQRRERARTRWERERENIKKVEREIERERARAFEKLPE